MATPDFYPSLASLTLENKTASIAVWQCYYNIGLTYPVNFCLQNPDVAKE